MVHGPIRSGEHVQEPVVEEQEPKPVQLFHVQQPVMAAVEQLSQVNLAQTTPPVW